MKEIFLLILLEALLVWCLVILFSTIASCAHFSEKTEKDLKEIHQFEKEHKIKLL